MAHVVPHADGGRQADRPPWRVADVLAPHAQALLAERGLGPEQRRAIRDILRCRTPALGGFAYVCDHCGAVYAAYNACRNRNCPSCQSLAQRAWIERRMVRVLPTVHYHVVFTLPAELRPIARFNRPLIYAELLRAAAQTLIAFGHDRRHIGGLIGVTTVLHTWTRDLRYHPHAHCVVTAGGLAPDGTRWMRPRSEHPRQGRKRRPFLFPVKALGMVFRAKVLDALKRAHQRGRLLFGRDQRHLADPVAFRLFLEPLARKPWVVYAKKPFGGPQQVFEYLGRYTHRVAISDGRILDLTDHHVTFRTKGEDTATLEPLAFARRFLQHVIPRGFTKIRHFGIYASAHVGKRLEHARQLLEPDAPPRAPTPVSDLTDALLALIGLGPQRCPDCGLGTLRRAYAIAPLSGRRPTPTLPQGRAPPPRTTP